MQLHTGWTRICLTAHARCRDMFYIALQFDLHLLVLSYMCVYICTKYTHTRARAIIFLISNSLR